MYQVRVLESDVRELFEQTSVLNRKVETLLDNEQANSFLEEEEEENGARQRLAHPAVQSLPEAHEEA